MQRRIEEESAAADAAPDGNGRSVKVEYPTL